MPRFNFLAWMLLPLTVGCQSGRDLNILGYSTRPQYDDNVRTVYVPVMKNTSFQTTTNRELEVDITKAVIREIEAKTPLKVVADRESADTELLGTLTTIQKFTLNTSQQNLPRETEVRVTVNVVWRDLRTGQVLSNRSALPPNSNVPFDPSLPPVESIQEHVKAIPAQIVATGRILPELGESNVTANQMVANNIAKQIIHMMEKPW